jgi:hypothetical protein
MSIVKETARKILLENLGTKLVALVAALFLFKIATSETVREQEFEMPIYVSASPAGRVIFSQLPASLKVRIRGDPEHVTSALASRPSLALDLSGFEESGTFTFTEEAIETILGEGIRVTSISPSSITVSFDKVEERTVPVRIEIARYPGPSYFIRDDGKKVNPATVKVSGPSRVLEKVGEVLTEAIDLSNEKGDYKAKVAVTKIDGATLSEDRVDVSIAIGEREGSAVFRKARIAVRNCPEGMTCTANPDYFTARVSGRLSMVNQVDQDTISQYVYLDFSGLSLTPEALKKGERTFTGRGPVIERLNGAVIKLTKESPKYFNVTVHARKR